MNHHCTYFDGAFLPQGFALLASLRAHDPGAILWVLALDASVSDALQRLADPGVRVVELATIEADDPALAAARGNRSRIEYYFTLSPCWPLWILKHQPDVPAVTYLDADLFFFSAAAPFFAELSAHGASVGITEHRYPPHLAELRKWGRFNVGILYFRGDARGLAVLEDWRARCLEWCHDRLEPTRFADQKYLDAWPERFGSAVHVVRHAGVNVAPWNWSTGGWIAPADSEGGGGVPLVVYHFAKFRRLGTSLWDSGQLEFAVMPPALREAVYGRYQRAVDEAQQRLAALGAGPSATIIRRGFRPGLKGWILRIVFGAVWYRSGDRWWALGLAPLGRHSGYWLSRGRRLLSS